MVGLFLPKFLNLVSRYVDERLVTHDTSREAKMNRFFEPIWLLAANTFIITLCAFEMSEVILVAHTKLHVLYVLGQYNSVMVATQVSPLFFHETHGQKVKISADMRTATRLRKRHKGVCFSNRSINVNEQIIIEINDTTPFWDGVVRLGFTYFDPANMNKDEIPTDLSPETTRPGYWAIELPETFVKKGNVLSFYVTPAGEVTYAMGGVEESVNFSGFDPNRPLWAVIDIYGHTTSVKIVGEW